METKAARRIAFALCFSLAAHAALLVFVGPRSGGAAAPASTTLHAWLERAGGDAIARSQDEPRHLTVPSERADEASASAPALEPATVRERAASEPLQPFQPSGAAKDRAAGGIEIPAARDHTYYSVAALDSPPRLLGTADLCYPPGASGEVAYQLLIDETGSVDQATLVAVRPEGLFTAGAVESCRALRFTPGIKDGRAVRSRVRFLVGPSPS